MRKMTIVGLSAAIAFVLAVAYGSAVMTAEVAQLAPVGASLLPIDVMQMMRGAKDLPEQQYGAI
jgi:predicted phage tail protein